MDNTLITRQHADFNRLQLFYAEYKANFNNTYVVERVQPGCLRLHRLYC